MRIEARMRHPEPADRGASLQAPMISAFQRDWEKDPDHGDDAGKFLVGAFRQGAQIFDRQEATVDVSTEDSHNFRNNLVTVRSDERLAFVIKYPDAFIKGDFNAALTG